MIPKKITREVASDLVDRARVMRGRNRWLVDLEAGKEDLESRTSEKKKSRRKEKAIRNKYVEEEEEEEDDGTEEETSNLVVGQDKKKIDVGQDSTHVSMSFM